MSRSQLDLARAHGAARGRRRVLESSRSPGSGSRFRLLSPANLGAGVLSTSGRWLSASPSACKLAGRDEQALLATTLSAITHPEDAALEAEGFGQLIAGEVEWYEIEKRLLTAVGPPLWVWQRLVVARDATGAAAHLIWQAYPSAAGDGLEAGSPPREPTPSAPASPDDPLLALGSLAAGVAHEIDEPLTYVVANIELVMQAITVLSREHRGGCSLVDGDALARRLDSLSGALRSAAQGVGRMHQIAGDMRAFSPDRGDRRSLLDVRSVIDPIVRMAWGEISRVARYERAFGHVPLVSANEARLAQVFLNLLRNATHAIGEGRPDKHVIRVVTRTDDQGRAVVEVSDTGRGIAKDHVRRVFDPFFTTKAAGLSAGLGLSICLSTVRELGGEIVVLEGIARGTAVRVTLPAATLCDAAADGCAERSPPEPTRARVLVVDDEPHITASLQMALSDRHDVRTATRASQALRMLASGERFDVILCDLMMPEMTGMDLHAALSRVLPGEARRMVFMTGGAFTLRAREFLDAVPNKRLEKPFDLDALSAMLSELARAAREQEG